LTPLPEKPKYRETIIEIGNKTFALIGNGINIMNISAFG
jgi:hypothetical protein